MTSTLPASRRITLLREVGETRMAALYAAELRAGDGASLVAVKVLTGFTPRAGGSGEGLAPDHRREIDRLLAMRDGARRLGRLDHPHVVAATDLAVVQGRPALVMPWVEGIDLLDWVEVLKETGTALPARVACDLARGVASALDAALHRAPWGVAEPLGVIHRDVKPSNVMISRDGVVKVLDFGTGTTSLAGREARAEARRAGADRYLAPGRRAGKRGGPGSDVYALGVLGVELLRGSWLNRLRDQNPAHDRHLAEVVARLPELGMRSPADDRALRSLLLRMLAWDAEARPTAGEVAQTLRVLADRAPGPSLEAFAHDHALPWLEPPEPMDGMPVAEVMDLAPPPPRASAPEALLPVPARAGMAAPLPSPSVPEIRSVRVPSVSVDSEPSSPADAALRALPVAAGSAALAAITTGSLAFLGGLLVGWLLLG